MKVGHDWPERGVLVSSAGRKVALVELLRRAADPKGIRVLTADSNPDAAAHRAGAGRLELPAIGQGGSADPRLLHEIIGRLREAGVSLVIPTRDGELGFWAAHAEALRTAEIEVVVSPWVSVRVALDKLLFAELGADAGLPVIRTSSTIDNDGPLVVKERFGAGSRSMLLGASPDQARIHARGLSNPVFQPLLCGDEFSADAWIGRTEEIRGPIVRRRTKIVDGESVVTETLRDPDLERAARSVLDLLPLRGPVNLQLIRTPDGAIHVLELNARFGGASTCSVHAGLDVWGWELQEAIHGSAGPFHRSETEVRQTRVRHADGSCTDRIETDREVP